MDTEGTPIQEVAAIEVNCSTHAIVDAFHGYAYTDEADTFARKHIHGLNKTYLKDFGFPSETDLLHMFKIWIATKPNAIIFCNGAEKERQALNLAIKEFKLLPWAERRYCASHQIAIRYKELTIPVCGQRCVKSAHSSFQTALSSSNASSSIAKARHGYHCALYDVMELYFECIMP